MINCDSTGLIRLQKWALHYIIQVARYMEYIWWS